MQAFFEDKIIPNQFIERFPGETELWIKREDLLHPLVSGNKFRKLKYNLFEAMSTGTKTILTFGGAHSNHIAATAVAAEKFGFKSIGVIRGEELENNKKKWSPTLNLAASCEMQFHFVNREVYREKDSEEFKIKLREKFGDFYLLPEGGTNDLAIKGCEEIVTPEDKVFDHIAVSAGTGGTLAGIINSSYEHQRVLGFPALKSDHFQDEVESMVSKMNWELQTDFHFGGYAKVDARLIEFMNNFRKKYGILLDPVYTGKLVFGIFELIKSSYFPERSRILLIHTGGLQGIEGMNRRLHKKALPQIQT